MNSTLVRVISAVVAILGLFAITYFGGSFGVFCLALLVITGGIFEFSNMTCPKEKVPKILKIWALTYLVFTFLTLALAKSEELSNFNFSLLAVSTLIFYSGGLWLSRNRYPNPALLTYFSTITLGALYFVSLPVFALKILNLPDGLIWFGLLLIIVFSGDTLAYFGGRFFGKAHLMPQISPKKTIAGAVSGLLGSAIGGVCLLYFLMPTIPWYWSAPFAIVCGFVAQAGDLFVSLVKRVAEVKDSGRIMPGHGGILDRLDGIYIAAPLVFLFAWICKLYLP